MTQPTPAAAPAAPAAAAPPASSTPAAPAAPVAAAPAAATSLLPADPGAAPAAPPVAAAAVPDPNSPKAYLLAEGVQGTGEAPDWFLKDKYANVAEQAKAYPDLQKRFGAFIGAPKDGKYDTKLPEGAGVELDAAHPLLGEFQKWAGANQLSQKGFTELMGMLGQYEAQHIVDPAAVKTAIGENADTRITAVAQWGKANLDAAGYEALRTALTPGKHSVAIFTALESVIAKTTQKKMPGPGADVPAGQPSQLAAIQAKMGVRDASGKLKYQTDEKYRAECERELQEAVAAQAA